MRLVLVGAGEYLPVMDPVDRALLHRLGEPGRVVCLPTAAGQEGAERIAYWSRLGENHYRGLGAEAEALPVIDRRSAGDHKLAERIDAANFIYFSGGKPAYLHDVLKESVVWEAVMGVVARGGVLAGCSAGAMIMGEKLFGFPGWKPGFGLLPGYGVIPHFDELPGMMVSSLKLFSGHDLTILGIDGGTALVQWDSAFEVMGKGGVTVITREGRTRYESGALALP